MKENMAHDINGRVSAITRSESPSIAEIIEKFQRIKEERLKQTENPYIRKTNNVDARFQRHGESGTTGKNLERPLSATQKMRDFVRDAAKPVPRRRMSLPSILVKPDTPPPLDEDWIDPSTTKRLQERSRAIARRYSISHGVHEYSKKDIKQLIRAEDRRGSFGEIKPLVAKPTDDDEEHWKRWLTGEDLHYFYNMWDKRKKPKLRLPRRLPPVHSCVNNLTVEDSVDRPRLNTF